MPNLSKLFRVLTLFSVSLPALTQDRSVPPSAPATTSSQEASIARPTNFDVISLKPYKSSTPVSAGEYSVSRVAASSLRGGPGTNNPERITAIGITLQRLAAAAYGVLSDQVSGPAWITETEYLLEAKVPPGTTSEQSKLMLQRALEERFKLVLHHEQRQFQTWALVIAKAPPRLKATADPNSAPKIGNQVKDGIRHDTFRSVRISKTDPNDSTVSLDMFLGLYLAARRRASASALPTVVDMTGLTGKYDFDLEYVSPALEDHPEVVGPTLLTALEEQLGLRLEQRKTALDALVIDHAEKAPIEN
jgi:uncharacterized protein (TIGR03435 family)